MSIILPMFGFALGFAMLILIAIALIKYIKK